MNYRYLSIRNRPTRAKPKIRNSLKKNLLCGLSLSQYFLNATTL